MDQAESPECLPPCAATTDGARASKPFDSLRVADRAGDRGAVEWWEETPNAPVALSSRGEADNRGIVAVCKRLQHRVDHPGWVIAAVEGNGRCSGNSTLQRRPKRPQAISRVPKGYDAATSRKNGSGVTKQLFRGHTRRSIGCGEIGYKQHSGPAGPHCWISHGDPVWFWHPASRNYQTGIDRHARTAFAWRTKAQARIHAGELATKPQRMPFSWY